MLQKQWAWLWPEAHFLFLPERLLAGVAPPLRAGGWGPGVLAAAMLLASACCWLALGIACSELASCMHLQRSSSLLLHTALPCALPLARAQKAWAPAQACRSFASGKITQKCHFLQGPAAKSERALAWHLPRARAYLM